MTDINNNELLKCDLDLIKNAKTLALLKSVMNHNNLLIDRAEHGWCNKEQIVLHKEVLKELKFRNIEI